MKVAIGADHGGFEMKERLFERLARDCEVIDAGAQRLDPEDDYPDVALAVARLLTEGKAERGILICGSGVGACIAANKVPGVRACLCHDTYSAHQGVEHDNMNVLCLGARVVGEEMAMELVRAFLAARFVDEGRFRRRLNKVLAIERQGLHGDRQTGGDV
jgi:ribose 5-phosphate isomerase B